MGFAGQVFAARVAIGLAMPSPRALTQAGSVLAKFTGGVYKKLNQEQTKAASDRLRLAKQDLKRANKAIQGLQKEQDNSIRKQAKNSVRQTQAMFDQSAFKTKKSITDFKNYVSKVQPAAAPRLFSGMNKDMSAAKQYQRMVENFISLGKEERKVILNNMKARSQAMKTQAKDFKELVNAMGAGGASHTSGGGGPSGGGGRFGGGPGGRGGGQPGHPGSYAGYDKDGNRLYGEDFIIGEDKEIGRGLFKKRAQKGWIENKDTLFASDWMEEDYGYTNRMPQPKPEAKDWDWYKLVDKRNGALKVEDVHHKNIDKLMQKTVAPPTTPGTPTNHLSLDKEHYKIDEEHIDNLKILDKKFLEEKKQNDKTIIDLVSKDGETWAKDMNKVYEAPKDMLVERANKLIDPLKSVNTSKTDFMWYDTKNDMTIGCGPGGPPGAKNASYDGSDFGYTPISGPDSLSMNGAPLVGRGNWWPKGYTGPHQGKHFGGGGGGPMGGMSPDDAVSFLDDIVDQTKHLHEIDRTRNDMLKKDNRELADLEEWRKEAQKELTEATKELADAEHQLHQETEKVMQETQQVIYLFKQEFIGNIRETISALAAFFWQLNGLTQELQEFERELLNANSVFNLTRDELFDTGEAVTQFGQQFGMSMQNGATGLYQLASAGVSANEALTILPETLKLSMAVQGDHNTISKLTAQTLFGFGLPMSQAAEVTDKFAHAIQKSLIEYQDLTSAIKFALPFFTATGQSLDQLLGALQVLTNRALEAGIAGRGLRQALSEFAEHADDNAAAFRKIGLEILNVDGTMKQLTEIASEYANIIGEDAVASTELLTSLIQDLNVRGATAFIHLVQNAEEFTQAVEDTANAGGELDQMVQIQNESISAQIQILKNNALAIFFMRDAAYEGTEYMNGFHEAILNFLETLKGLLVTELANGTYELTEFSKTLRGIAIKAVELFTKASKELVKIIKDFTEAGFFNISMLKAFFAPLMAVLKVIKMIGPDVLKLYISFRIYSKILGLEAIPYTKIFTTSIDLLKMGMSSLAGIMKHVISSIKYYTIAVASGEGAEVATSLWAGSIGKLKGILGALVKVLFSWQTLAVAAVATLGIAASTTTDWSNIVSGLSLGFKELISTLWVGLEPLIISIQNAREAFGGWLGDVTGMESQMILIRTMQEIGAFLGTFVQLAAKVLGFFVDIGVTIGGWFVDSLGPDSHWAHFVQFWEDWVDPEVDIDWGTAWTHTTDFLVDIGMAFVNLGKWFVDRILDAWNWVVGAITGSDFSEVDLPHSYNPGPGHEEVLDVILQGTTANTGGARGGTIGPPAPTHDYGQGPTYDTWYPSQYSSFEEYDRARRAEGQYYSVNQNSYPGMSPEMVEELRQMLIQQEINRALEDMGLPPQGTSSSSSDDSSWYDTHIGTPSHNFQQDLIESGWAYWNPFGGDSQAYQQSQQNVEYHAIGGKVPRYSGGGPVMVGEMGPEIFIPSTSGRIVANKDLNSRRTRNMLSDWRNRGDGGGGGASVMTVGTLISANSVSKNSKISIDSYAGVV